MELIYLYIGKIEDIFENCEIYFSKEYIIKFENKQIKIKKNKNYIKYNYFGEGSSNHHLIIGKNGAGKTTILNLLGCTKSDLISMYYYKDNWFFKIYKREIGDEFLIEVFDDGFTNFFEYKIPDEYTRNGCYSIICKLNDDNYLESNSFKIIGRKTNEFNELNDHTPFFYNFKPIKNTSDHLSLTLKKYMQDFTLSNLYTCFSDSLKDVVDFYNENVQFLLKTSLVKKSNYEFKLYNGKIDQLYKIDEKIEGSNEIVQYNHQYIISYLEKFFFYYMDKMIYHRMLEDDKGPLIRSFNKVIYNQENNNTYLNRKNYMLEIIDEMLTEYLKKEKMMSDESPIDILNELITHLENNIIFYPNRFFEVSSIKITNNTPNEKENIERFLKFYEKTLITTLFIPETISIILSELSTGEFELLKIFSQFNYIFVNIEKMLVEKRKKDNKDNKTLDLDYIKNCYILFDEIEKNLHPEYSRNLLKYIIDIFNTKSNYLNVTYKVNIKFNLIITSHSPFLCTDFPKENILKINITEMCSEGSKKIVRDVTESEFGLLSNINDLINYDFFLSSPYGEYAKQQLFAYRNLIKSSFCKESKDKIQLFINTIDNDLIRKFLETEFVQAKKRLNL